MKKIISFLACTVIIGGTIYMISVGMAKKPATVNDNSIPATSVAENGEVLQPVESKPRRAQIIIKNRIGGETDSSNNK